MFDKILNKLLNSPIRLKLVRITLETWKFQKIVSKNIPFSTKALLILLVSAFFLQQ